MTTKLTLENIALIEKLVNEEEEFTWDHDTAGITMRDFIQAAKDKLGYQNAISNIRKAIEEQCTDLILIRDVWQDVSEASEQALSFL